MITERFRAPECRVTWITARFTLDALCAASLHKSIGAALCVRDINSDACGARCLQAQFHSPAVQDPLCALDALCVACPRGVASPCSTETRHRDATQGRNTGTQHRDAVHASGRIRALPAVSSPAEQSGSSRLVTPANIASRRGGGGRGRARHPAG